VLRWRFVVGRHPDGKHRAGPPGRIGAGSRWRASTQLQGAWTPSGVLRIDCAPAGGVIEGPRRATTTSTSAPPSTLHEHHRGRGKDVPCDRSHRMRVTGGWPRPRSCLRRRVRSATPNDSCCFIHRGIAWSEAASAAAPPTGTACCPTASSPPPTGPARCAAGGATSPTSWLPARSAAEREELERLLRHDPTPVLEVLRFRDRGVVAAGANLRRRARHLRRCAADRARGS
jgi:hypothetical protein